MDTQTAIKERPILFPGPMVQAILSGHKTVTRRIVKGADEWQTVDRVIDDQTGDEFWRFAYSDGQACQSRDLSCPYGQRGERLWVRETFDWITGKQICTLQGETKTSRISSVRYRADGVKPLSLRWSPAIHMPRILSRITLEIVSIRVQRLHEITEAEAVAEGSTPTMLPANYLVVDSLGRSCSIGTVGKVPKVGDEWLGSATITHIQHVPASVISTARDNFLSLWHEINGKASWDAWVWVVEFKRLPSP